MQNKDVSKIICRLSVSFIAGSAAGIASWVYLNRKKVKNRLLASETAEILREVWADLHNICYGDTTVNEGDEAAASVNRPDDDDIIDID